MVLLSRVAEALFWLGRYVERAENTARLLNVSYHGRFEATGVDMLGATNTWRALMATLGLTATFEALAREPSDVNVIEFLTVSRDNPASIVSSLEKARANAHHIRDYISNESWEAINRAYLAVSGRTLGTIMADGLGDFCENVRDGANLFRGTAHATLLHDEGWQWLRSGLALDQADMMTRLVDSKYHLLLRSVEDVGSPIDRYQWAALLRSVSGWEAFRRSHPEGIEAASVAQFLLLSTDFPRSLRASVDDLREALDLATAGAVPRLRNSVMRPVTDLQNRLRYESADQLLTAGLHEFIAEVQQTLAEVTAAIRRAFFWSVTDAV